jgi:hypothetical protein
MDRVGRAESKHRLKTGNVALATEILSSQRVHWEVYRPTGDILDAILSCTCHAFEAGERRKRDY